MLRNEDRLYHIVVTFPSICAKQFLIVKFRKNEALCCLIGFGIGISCCLMYRWFKNTFFSIDMSKSNRFIYEHHHYHHYKSEKFLYNKNAKSDENTTATSLLNQFNRKSKTRAKKLKKDSRSNSLINNNQPFQHEDIIKKNVSDPETTSTNFSNLTYRSNQSQVPNFNLTKSVTKKCLKSFKLRRAIKKQKNLYNNLDLFSNRKQSQIDDGDLENESKNSKVTLLSDDADQQMTTSKYFDLDDKSTNSGNCLGNGVFGEDETENDFLSLSNSKTNLSFNKASNKYLNDSSFLNYLDNNDSIDFGRSIRSSAGDFDDLNSRNPLNKSNNSVDKSLDEALHHIDKLKEDMNHLCNDIDTLYKAKNLSNINNLSLKNNSYQANINIDLGNTSGANEIFKKITLYEFNDYTSNDFQNNSSHFTNFILTKSNEKLNKVTLDKSSQTKIFLFNEFSYSDCSEDDKSTTNTNISSHMYYKKRYSPSCFQTSTLESNQSLSNSLNSKKLHSFSYCNLSRRLISGKKKSPLHR